MAVKSIRYGDAFLLEGEYTGEAPNLRIISESSIINEIVKKFQPSRRVIAKKQIGHLIRKIRFYPEKIMFYITLIKKLIEFETNGVKNE